MKLKFIRTDSVGTNWQLMPDHEGYIIASGWGITDEASRAIAQAALEWFMVKLATKKTATQ